MKKIANLPLLAVLAVVNTANLQAVWAGTTSLWKFPAGATNQTPVSGGASTATVLPGSFASGWMAHNDILGNANGIWDLGRNGTIVLDHLPVFPATPGQSQQLTIRVVQFNGGPYADLATVSIPGARCVHTNQLATVIPSLASPVAWGDWVANETQWNLPPGVAANNVVITSAYNGSLVNQVSLVSTSVATTMVGPQLTIQWLIGDQSKVQISWPTALTNQLQATADLLHPHWTAVNAPVTTATGFNFVTVSATEAAQFSHLAAVGGKVVYHESPIQAEGGEWMIARGLYYVVLVGKEAQRLKLVRKISSADCLY